MLEMNIYLVFLELLALPIDCSGEKLIQNKSYYYVKEMDNVTLKCKTGKNSTLWFGPKNYELYANGYEINPAMQKQNRLRLVTGKSDTEIKLQISNFSKDDEGNYKCTHDGGDDFFEIRLQVDSKILQIENETANSFIYGSEEESLKLVCSVDRDHHVKTTEWKSDNKTLVSENKSIVNYTFIPEHNDHLKYFTCVANLEKTFTPLTRTVQLFLYLKPHITIVQPNVSVNVGNSLTLRCNYTSNDNLTGISWKQKGLKEQATHYYSSNKSTLHVNRVNCNHAGNYECNVKNRAGEATGMFFVTVHCPPQTSVTERIIPESTQITVFLKPSSDDKQGQIEPLHVIIPVVFVVFAVLASIAYHEIRKENQSVVSCLKLRRAAGNPNIEEVPAVANNIDDFGHNVGPTVNNQEIPFYSSIDRRENVMRADQLMTYSVSGRPQVLPVMNANYDDNATNRDQSHQSGMESANLNYIEIFFDKKPKDYKFIIRGSGNKTPYADIDFTQTAPCLSSSDEEEDSNDDFEYLVDMPMKFMPIEHQ